MKIFALLIGIDNYPSKPLRGCVNDIIAVEKFLKDTYAEENLKIEKILNEKATRQGLIDGFSLFSKATDGDTCLFYYSGHGSYMTAAKEFWTETDGLLETLVCVDSRVENGRDLSNKELGFLIWQYSFGKKINFVVITDSCHSGSVTRELQDENIWRSDRTTPTRDDIQPVEQFYGFDLVIDGKKGYTDIVENGVRKVSISVADHIHLAASRDNQTAKEDEINGLHHGIFTHSLLQILYQNNAKINYENLISQATARVKTMALDQDPSLSMIGLGDSVRQKVFLNDEILKSGERIYRVSYDKAKGWSISGGAVNGFQVGDKISIKEKEELKISTVGIDVSLFSLPISVDLDDTKIYDAKVIKNNRIAISFNKYEWEQDWKTQAAIESFAQNSTDFFLTNYESGTFFIRKKDDKLFLSPKNSSWAMFKKIDISSENAFQTLIENIDKVCRWYQLKNLDNPNSFINTENFEVKIEEIGVGEAKKIDDGYSFYYKFDEKLKEWQPPQLKISLTNKTKIKELKASPVYLNFDYTVDTSTFNDLTLKDVSQNVFFTDNGTSEDILSLNLDEKYIELGYNQVTEYLKIFVSTSKLNLVSFAQSGIEMETTRGANDKNIPKESRSLGKDLNKQVKIEDWQVFTIKLTITKTSEEELGNLQNKKFASGLELKNTSQFRGKIGFSTSIELKQRGFRGVAGQKDTKQVHEIKGNDIFQPADLVANHGQGQSLNVIEIFDAKNPELVNGATPLEIIPQNLLSSNETIVPFGYDETTDSYFPLGLTDSEGKIIINQLPAETPSDAAITKRSFFGSIKIYFYKVIGQKIGLKYDYPQLAVAKVDENEKMEYVEKDLEIIKQKVSEANKIVLFIHGIIGDTEEMVKVIRRAKTPNGKLLAENFDLVLTFDYENLNTEINQTAIDLKERLKSVGLVENHGKELVIIAHSMGGLVSRYFIEKLGGEKIVNHLIMLGTPNGGSEWADVRDLAETLISTAVGGAAFLKPWLIPLSFVGKLLKGTQTTLQQMNDKGDSSIIKILNDGTKPTTKYSIIAGNTQLLGNSAKIESALKRVLARIKEKPAYAALDIAVFQNEPNDIAVKVKNIKKINHSIADVFEVASDHISYFGEPKAIEKLGGLF